MTGQAKPMRAPTESEPTEAPQGAMGTVVLESARIGGIKLEAALGTAVRFEEIQAVTTAATEHGEFRIIERGWFGSETHTLSSASILPRWVAMMVVRAWRARICAVMRD